MRFSFAETNLSGPGRRVWPSSLGLAVPRDPLPRGIAGCSGLRSVAVPGDALTVVAAATVVSRGRLVAGEAHVDGPVAQSIAAVIAVVRAITTKAAVGVEITAAGVVRARLQSAP